MRAENHIYGSGKTGRKMATALKAISPAVQVGQEQILAKTGIRWTDATIKYQTYYLGTTKGHISS